MPSAHEAAYWSHKVSDLFDASGPCTIADCFNGRAEYSFTWNTKTLAAIKCIMQTKIAQSHIKDILFCPPKPISKALGVTNRVFRVQNSSFELNFNGFQEAAEAGVLDIAINMFEAERLRSARYWYDGEGTPSDGELYNPLPRKPTEEEIKAAIAAVGQLSGKTFGGIRNELLSLGPIIPGAAFGLPDNCCVSPLYPLKQMLELIPEQFADAKKLGLAVLATVSGIKQGGLKGHVLKAGIECRGVDPFMILPTEEQIMAASASAEFEDNMQMATYVAENPHFLMKFAASEYKEAQATLNIDMIPPIESVGMPDSAAAAVSAMTYTPEELAEYKDKLSEIIAIVKAFEPLMDEVTFPGDKLDMPAFLEPAFNYGKERVKSVLLN